MAFVCERPSLSLCMSSLDLAFLCFPVMPGLCSETGLYVYSSVHTCISTCKQKVFLALVRIWVQSSDERAWKEAPVWDLFSMLGLL